MGMAVVRAVMGPAVAARSVVNGRRGVVWGGRRMMARRMSIMVPFVRMFVGVVVVVPVVGVAESAASV